MTRLLLISDIHGNVESLKAVIESAPTYDEVLVLGDLVDYGPDPDAVIDIIKELGGKVVEGNHDHAVVKGVDCRAGPSLHDASVYTRKEITDKKLSRTDLRWLASLPDHVRMDLGSQTALAVHATPKDRLFKYLQPWLPEEEFKEYVGEEAPSLILVGHTHRRFLRPTSFGKVVINPGSVGQPRDGDWRASYAVLTDEGSVEFFRVKYDVETTIRKLKESVRSDEVFLKLANILRSGR
ncbi:MAG: metallophosphoesterase family protein [Desulfurococcales archaeon]|nr:metallophosphoesterase family protein [Desulfurococcales archaeon]